MKLKNVKMGQQQTTGTSEPFTIHRLQFVFTTKAYSVLYINKSSLNSKK